MPVKIDYERCNSCRRCYDLCPLDVFTWDEETRLPTVAYEEECWHCGICWMECPNRCIDIAYPASCW